MSNDPASNAQAGTSITFFKEASDVHIGGNTAFHTTVNNNNILNNNHLLQGKLSVTVQLQTVGLIPQQILRRRIRSNFS